MKRLLLFAKGLCMGVADIIPGVSGGTLALILGIYAELVNTIRGLNLRWVLPLWRWLRGGRRPEDWAAVVQEVRALNLVFVIVLGAGIVTAISIGGLVIPTLMENYPEIMRGLFFGLIIASVVVPFRMITFPNLNARLMVGVMIVLGAAAGFFISDPGRLYETSSQWVEVQADGTEKLEQILRRGPSAWPSEAVYWAPQNTALRAAMAEHYPEQAALLDDAHEQAAETYDKDEIKERSAPYDELVVPADTPVNVPRPALWFVFLAGAIAICAMILPGISGSYILLIMGAYFFMLNALKGFILTLAAGAIPTSQAVFVIIFCAGAGIGLLSFARLLSYLLRRHTTLTLGVLVGLMVGCLRGIWPFRDTLDGVIINVLPTSIDNTVIGALVACLAGAGIVVAMMWIRRSKHPPM